MNVQTFIHDLRHADLPPPVAALARRCLLDLVGVAASGRRTDLARIVTDHAARQFGAGEGRGARMIFDGRRVSPAGAAYVGASLIDSFDAHDGHALTKGHAGVAILPALLAFWEAEDLALDDREVLTSIVIGYEIATRAGIALHASACDYHTSGAWNALACAALGARLLKLSPAQTREALGTAEYHGPRSRMMRCIDHPTMLKDGSGWGRSPASPPPISPPTASPARRRSPWKRPGSRRCGAISARAGIFSNSISSPIRSVAGRSRRWRPRAG
ncbi:MmgE/PrpD family protein [Ancylobacter dichloromethanicus]